MSSNDFFTTLREAHPYITICSYAGQDYVGIIQNRDNAVTTMYDYGSIVTVELRELFLSLGDVWWWESNREIPINLFLKKEWEPFKPFLKTFSNKNLEIIHGPIVSITDFSKKRIKRKSITLVRKVN